MVDSVVSVDSSLHFLRLTDFKFRNVNLLDLLAVKTTAPVAGCNVSAQTRHRVCSWVSASSSRTHVDYRKENNYLVELSPKKKKT